jgi:hypothetical protein
VHTAGIAKATLAKACIKLVPPFPPCSPDLNSIGRVGTPETSHQRPQTTPNHVRGYQGGSHRGMGLPESGGL